MRKLFSPWLGAIAVLVIIFGTMYTLTQQAQRNTADFPQIQIAEDATSALNHNVKPASLTGGYTKVDLKTSLAPFVIVYDKSGQIVSGSGYLNNKVPVAPYGILTSASGQEYHRVTWQPESDVRIAAVTVSSNNYYVLSGRSLKEVEKNESESLHLATLGGLLSLVVLVGVYKFHSFKPSKRS